MEDWPENVDHSRYLTMEDPEVRNAMVCVTIAEDQKDTVLELMQYFLSWIRLKSVVAWLIRVKSILLGLS